MSDFDKEAERERLREKYESEAEDRAETQRMSQLLLRGATMTNKHCDRCGSPVFRYDDQEFCPNCQDEAAEGAAEAAVDDGPDAAAAAVEESEQATTGASPGAEADAVDGADDEATTAADAATATDTTPDATTDVGQQSAESQPTGGETTAGQAGRGRTGGPDRTAGAITERTATDRAPPAGDLGEARASLVRTLTAMAERAEAAEDPRRARELLGAAREAAEAIAALDR
jgi:uncharacterized Zn finger protein (UPF0148 family)